MTTELQEKLKQVKFVITDVDGVLTDGLLHYDANGEALKSFHVRDGLGIRMLMEARIQVAVLSGRDSAILRKRIADLGIKLAFLGKLEKESPVLNYAAKPVLSRSKRRTLAMTALISPLSLFVDFPSRLPMRRNMSKTALITP